MQWWNDFLNWLGSDTGWRVLTTAVFPFVAILVAAIIAALIGRGATRRLIAHQDRELQAAAVAAMIESGRSATMWSSLTVGAQTHSDSQFNAADIRIRLLPLSGASAAADWATHEIRSMRRDSAGFSFQAEQTFADYRDRLLEWQRRPSRARKLFALDLERFRFEDSSADTELVEQQRRWAAQQAAAEQAAVSSDESPADVSPFVASAPVQPTAQPTPAPTPAPAATQAYAMPVAASDHVNEGDPSENGAAENDATSTENGGYVMNGGSETSNTSEPHFETEEDPEDELEGVELAQPVLHNEPTGFDEPVSTEEPESAEQSGSKEWTGEATQALPLIEPADPYASTPDAEQNRTY